MRPASTTAEMFPTVMSTTLKLPLQADKQTHLKSELSSNGILQNQNLW